MTAAPVNHSAVLVPTIVVLGGGLSGALFAWHLRRDHPGLRARVVVVEPRACLGAGLAYDTDEPEHRLNIPAARVVVLEEQPEHFAQWVVRRGIAEADPGSVAPDGHIYPRRAVLGEYLADLLDGSPIEHRRAEAIGAQILDNGVLDARVLNVRVRDDTAAGRFRIELSDGDALVADALVIALGHPPPALPAPLAALPPTHCVADAAGAPAIRAIDPDAAVIVLGTGLTGCDVAAVLQANGHRGPVTMLSRRGLLPRRRAVFVDEAMFDFATDPARTVRELLRRVRARVRETVAAGTSWELVTDALRRQGTQVWGALPLVEKRRLLRHLRAFWDAHRFQSAPQIDARLDTLIATGQGRVLAATLRGARLSGDAKGGQVILDVLLRGGARAELVADVVVNCTGPGHRGITASLPVLADLARAGALRADPCGLGLDTDAEGRLRRADGTPWACAWAVGPLARYAYGELMGLPQVSFQPRDVARLIARELAARPVAVDADLP